MPNLALHNKLEEFPSLRLMLSRSNMETNPYCYLEPLLFSLFSLPVTDELPVAAVTGLADRLATQTDYWLRADPVELRPDLAAIYFLGNEHIQLNNVPNDKNIAELKELFYAEGITLHMPNAKRWYISLPNDPQINTSMPTTIIGKDITPYLPYGAQQNLWRRLLTEVQMLLHERYTQFNALWFWGAGRLPEPEINSHKRLWQKVWSDHELGEGLAQLTNIPSNQPRSLEHSLSEMETDGEYLVVITKNNIDLENQWFKPLISALHRHALASAKFYLGNDKVYCITDKSIRYFWRRRQIIL